MFPVNWHRGLWRLWCVFAVAWWGFWIPAALTGVGMFRNCARGDERCMFLSKDAQDFLGLLIFLLPLLFLAGGYAMAWVVRGFVVKAPVKEPSAWEKRPPLKVR